MSVANWGYRPGMSPQGALEVVDVMTEGMTVTEQLEFTEGLAQRYPEHHLRGYHDRNFRLMLFFITLQTLLLLFGIFLFTR